MPLTQHFGAACKPYRRRVVTAVGEFLRKSHQNAFDTDRPSDI